MDNIFAEKKMNESHPKKVEFKVYKVGESNFSPEKIAPKFSRGSIIRDSLSFFTGFRVDDSETSRAPR